MIGAVLFDLDGVLVETRGLHRYALDVALRGEVGLSLEDRLATDYEGLPTRVKLEKLAAVPGYEAVAAKVERIVEVKNRVTRDHLPAFVRFDPSLYCLFSGLEKLGVRLCVVTNAIRETAEACCRILKVDSIVDHLGAPVVGLVSPSDGFRPKPAWDIYDAAVSHVGLAPRECLAVEDNEKGVTSAAAAGCNVWKVSWPADVTAAALWVEAAKYGGFA